MLKTHTASLLIKPASYLCNIECAHCFYKRVEDVYPEHRPFMERETMATLVRKTLALGCGHNTFCWQGGEPTLMGIDFFREVVRAQKRFGLAGQVVGNSLQTNGVLIDSAWAEFLAENRFLVGLSIDGPREFHDHYRMYASGAGTFDRALHAVEVFRNHGVEFNVLTLLTDANVSAPETLYRFFREQGFSHLQFVPCFEKDPTTGEDYQFSISAEELGNFHCRLFDLWLDDGFPDVSIRIFEDILIYFIDGVHVSCNWYEQCASYFVIEHNGDVYPCDFFVYPEWRLGNIIEDSYEKIARNPLLEKFAQMKSALPDACMECRWQSFCHGDCTKFRLDGDGGYGNVSAYCTARKMLLEHIEPHVEPLKERVLEIRRRGQAPVRYPGVGRNDPCPCGSGRKFKKCCGR
jgi:uncharacterized protein